MAAQEGFGIVVRTVGVACLVYGLWLLVVWLRYALGFASLLESEVRIRCLFMLVVGLLALREADWVVRFAYPEDDRGAAK